MKHDQRAKILPFPQPAKPTLAEHVAEVTPRERAPWWHRWRWALALALLALLGAVVTAALVMLGVAL